MANTGMISIVLILLCTICGVSGLFADQAGLFDWKQDYVGKVKVFHWEQAPSAGKKVLVASEKNVIASLNAHDGSIVWRRIFEPSVRGCIDDFLHKENLLVSIHAGGQFVRSWDVGSGSLKWEKSFSDDVNSWATGFFVQRNSKEHLILATSDAMYCLKMSDGSLDWKADLPNSETVERWYMQQQGDKYIAIGITPGQRVTVVTVSEDGAVSKPKNVPAPWIAIDTSCVILEDSKHFVCYSPQTSSLQLLALDNVNVFKPTDLKLIDVSTSPESQIEAIVPQQGPTILFRSSPDKLVLMSLTSQQSFSVSKTLDKTYAAKVEVHGEKYILLTLSQADAETLKLTATDLKANTEITDLSQNIPFAHYHGHPTKMFPFLFSKKKESQKPGCKLILLAQDYSLHCTQKGKAQWRREEAMAYIVAVQMVDLPVSENQAKFEDEFGTKEEDILAMFIKRLKAQFSQLKGLGIRLSDRILGHHHHHAVSMDAIEEEEPEEGDLIRDDFNLHKIIVVATVAGKIYGIRSHTGKIAWQQFVPDLKPFSRYGNQKLLLVVQRTTAHFPHEPQCTVLGVSQKTDNGLVVSFNPITGAMISGHQGQGYDLGYKVVQAEMLAEMDEDFLKGIILIDDKIKPHVYPKSSEKALHNTEMQLFFHLVDPDTGIMTGYRILPGKKEGIDIGEIWNLDLQKSQQTITGVYGKRALEHVHSQGRVLGDRSVLYKYLNPNLVAVVAEGEEQPQAASNTKGPSGFFSIYLVDGVTGHIVYHQTHKRSKGPVKVIHSENWLVYSYFNEKHRRSEIGVLELYEGKEQSNSTAFSSFSPPPPPLVLRQSYIFPEPVYAMEATVTEKGITSKNIILALKIGGILSLPKALLDPRRPVMPTQETMEEGTIPYVPEIPLSTEALVNYNKSMFNVNGVFTAPAGLESTSLVFMYGVDVFYTRVMPSRMFDVLKEDFDYLFIGGVLGLMILVSFVTQKLAAGKALKRAWK